MSTTSRFGRKRAAVGVGAILLMAASLTVAAAVNAQSGPTSNCSSNNPIQFGSQFFGIGDFGNHLLSDGPTQLEFAYSLPAGTYNISAVSTDGYEARSEITQTEEQWFAQFLAGGSVIATTAPTRDVPDGIDQGIWSGSLGEVVLDSAVDTVRLVHRAPGTPSQNSVRPVCIGATLTSAPVVEVLPPAEVVEVPPGEVLVEVAGVVDTPTERVEEATPDEPVEVEVLDEVVTAPVAQSTEANPTFTG